MRAERTSTRASTRAEACAEGSVAQEAFQKFVRSNRSCVERRQGQKTGTVLPTANHVDALLLNKEVCDNHEYYYGIVVIVSEKQQPPETLLIVINEPKEYHGQIKLMEILRMSFAVATFG